MEIVTDYPKLPPPMASSELPWVVSTGEYFLSLFMGIPGRACDWTLTSAERLYLFK